MAALVSQTVVKKLFRVLLEIVFVVLAWIYSVCTGGFVFDFLDFAVYSAGIGGGLADLFCRD